MKWERVETVLPAFGILVEHRCTIGQVDINFSEESKRLRYALGNKITYGHASSLKAAQKEVAAIADKLSAVRTMRQLLTATIIGK